MLPPPPSLSAAAVWYAECRRSIVAAVVTAVAADVAAAAVSDGALVAVRRMRTSSVVRSRWVIRCAASLSSLVQRAFNITQHHWSQQHTTARLALSLIVPLSDKPCMAVKPVSGDCAWACCVGGARCELRAGLEADDRLNAAAVAAAAVVAAAALLLLLLGCWWLSRSH